MQKKSRGVRSAGGGSGRGGVRFGEGVGERRIEVIVKCKTKLGGCPVGGGVVRVDMNEE